MIKNPFKFIYFIAVIIATGCASGGSHIVTGEIRPRIDRSLVRIYETSPENSKKIGLVTGFAFGWTGQAATTRAIQKLKDNSALIGANGITSIQFLDVPGQGFSANATAIFVP